MNSKWDYEIGDIVDTKYSKLKIIDRAYTDEINGFKYKNKYKFYKYKCLKCGFEDWKNQGCMVKKTSCRLCTNQVAVLGVNTIWDKAKWMCDLGISEEDAKKYCPQSGQKIWVTCPDCGEKKEIKINNLYNRHSIGCTCGDGKSYPEKYVYELLNQLNIKFDYQVKYEWNKYKDPHKQKVAQGIIDFVLYIDNREIPLEVDGDFHRFYNNRNKRTKEDSIYIDHQRDLNSLKYLGEETIRVIFDDYNKDMKQNILNSKLNNLFNLSNIDWNKCEEYALKNIIKEVCIYKEEHPELTTGEIGKLFNINRHTVREYCIKGTKFNWCNYKPSKEREKNYNKMKEMNKKLRDIHLKAYKDGELIGIFDSASELSRLSIELVGEKLCGINISKCLRNNKMYKKHYTFEYATKEELEEYKKSINN